MEGVLLPIDPARYRKNPAIEEAPLQGEMMLFDPATSKFYVLNPTMAFAWTRCDGQHSLPVMATQLVEEFSGISGGEAEADLGKAFEELLNLGLLVDAIDS